VTAILDAVSCWARERPAALALATGQRDVTYAELAGVARQRSAELSRRGYEPGARLAILAADPFETLATVLGACELGASTLLVSASSPALAVTRLVEQFGGEATIRGRGFSSVAQPRQPDATALDPGPALALATSGVTGRAKVAQREWQAVAASAESLAEAIELSPDDVLLCTTPLHHAYSFVAGLVGCLLRGATYVAPPTPTTPAILAELSVRYGVTILFSVPVLYRWYLESTPLTRPPRLAVSAGERLPSELLEGWRELYAQELCNHYGSTELGMLTLELGGEPGSVGWPLRGVEIEVDAETAGCAPYGEVVARPVGGPPLLLDVESGTRRDARAQAAFRSGDVGWLGGDGRLYLEGRLGTTLNLGGEKVIPSQVEEVMRSYSSIRDCAVVCVRAGGETPRLCAFVEADDELDMQDLRAFLCVGLSVAQIPSMIRRVRQLPRTATGKVHRDALCERAHAVARLTQRR
jgi:acyl-coenzyme A synthetase/AMP-(fatty) acid ligase